MKLSRYFILLICSILFACGGNSNVKKPPKPSSASKTAQSTSASNSPQTNGTTSKPGGYYLDDGPGENPPQNIDSIPSPTPKKEPLLARANKPYKALGTKYTPMKSYQPYKEKGVASWYGKRFHGKKTASGEIYDMYSMSAAHTTLPIPSYAKVTNPANGRSVIVRVNDRGPFKNNRIMDLSYAAAYQLRFISNGSTLVEVEALDPNQPYTPSPTQNNTVNVANNTGTAATQNANTSSADVERSKDFPVGWYIQVGAFKNEANADSLTKKIQALGLAENVGMNSVYNNGLYRLKLGPFSSRQEADKSASGIRRQLNLSTIISTQ
jgi:rare lipoprotein A